jgi:tetratricopeptide (TPR) repeat protein
LLGQFHKTIEYNWSEVHREMALALQLNPGSPLVRMRYAVSDLMPHGRLEEAIAEIELALESDPLSLLMQAWLGVMLVIARKWDLAIDQAHRVLQLDPSALWGHFVMGVAYRGKKMYKEAVAAHRLAVKLSGGMPALIGWLGLALGLGGNAAEARSLLERLHYEAAQGHVPPTSVAWIYLGLGEIDTAFEWLNRAVDECDQFMMPIKSYEFFDPIRGDPRFGALVRKMNLEP